MEKIKLTIEGMHCVACAGNVEREIRKVEGVDEVSVNALAHKAFIEGDSVSVEDLKKAVSKAGYKVVEVEK